MTDGSITYTNSEDELKSFNVKDGFALVQWKRLGKKLAIITGRESKIVAIRALELGVDYLEQNVKRKEERLRAICEEIGIGLHQVAAIGDDLNDYRLLQSVGISFAPADAYELIKESVDVLLTRPGGKGAVREMVETLLKREGLFEEYLAFWTQM